MAGSSMSRMWIVALIAGWAAAIAALLWGWHHFHRDIRDWEDARHIELLGRLPQQ